MKLTLNESRPLKKEIGGKAVRISGVRKNLQLPPKFISGVWKYHWIYSFKLLDESGFIEIEVDYYDKAINIFNQTKCK